MPNGYQWEISQHIQQIDEPVCMQRAQDNHRLGYKPIRLSRNKGREKGWQNEHIILPTPSEKLASKHTAILCQEAAAMVTMGRKNEDVDRT